jgi:hypothetical protein
MLAMKNIEKDNVVNFPTKNNKPVSFMSESELVYDAKMAWVQPINWAITGVRKLTEDDKDTIRYLMNCVLRAVLSLWNVTWKIYRN